MRPCLLLPLLGALLLPACGAAGGGAGGTARISQSSFVAGIRHEYFPLGPGWVWTYEGTDEGRLRWEQVRTLPEPARIAGVSCVAVYQEVYLDGELAEATTEWYAEDRSGNVWKFGEESYEAQDGAMVLTEDSWKVGEGAAWPWMQFPAQPSPGQVISGYAAAHEEDLHVVSVTATAITPAGVFEDCLQILENPDDPEDTDIILYAPGLGRVVESNADGQTYLTSVARP